MRIRIEITTKLSSTGYLLQMEGSKREAEVHVGELKRYSPQSRVVNGFEKYASEKGVDWKHAGVFALSPFSPLLRIMSWLES